MEDRSPARGCLGCGVTLLAMGLFGLIYPWEISTRETGMDIMSIMRSIMLAAGLAGVLAVVTGLVIWVKGRK